MTTEPWTQNDIRPGKGRQAGHRIGPLDLVKFYQVCHLKHVKKMSEKDIGTLLGLSRQAVNYQLNLHNPLREDAVVTQLLVMAQNSTEEDSEMLKMAARTILEQSYQIKQYAISTVDKLA